ncbi:MAG TPA: FKBP-type peptidyl-prolyl cis-trans isomerase [Jatrophihabitantaceae bacterium]|nr:FKBP-type peptidyl-prolyl cis-trans isomerase [Jatrophihabitantaceae bacterium]
MIELARLRRVTLLLVVPAVLLTACGTNPRSSPPSPPASSASLPAATGPTVTTASGVQVTGSFGQVPKVVVPATPAPSALTQQTITQGTGATVVAGDTLVANYIGQTWALKSGKVDVFDSSFARAQPLAGVIGEGHLISGWDKALVGKKVGSRVVLTIPPADGYGTAGQPSVGITGTDTLVFVIDLIAAYGPNASAPGTVVPNIPTAGLPKITNVPGRAPAIVSMTGVKAPATPTSTLLVTGGGAKIDTTKTLVFQYVETDIATGKVGRSSWGQAPQTESATSLLGIVDKLDGQKIGARALVLLPATPAIPATASTPAEPAVAPMVLIIDVVGQF